MTVYDTAGFTAAMNLYLQNPRQYPEPNWSNFVLSSSTGAPQGGNAGIPAPHVDAPTVGSDPNIALSVLNPNADKNQEKITTEKQINNSKVTYVPQNQFGGGAGEYGNPVETIIPAAKVETGISTIIKSPVESIENIGQTVIPKPNIEAPAIAPIPSIVSPTLNPQTLVAVTNKVQTQKVPLSDSQVLQIHSYVDSVSKTLSDAQASGAKNLLVTVNGKTIDNFPINANTKEILFSALPDLQKNYGNIQLSFVGQGKESSTTQKVPLNQSQIDLIHNYAESVVQTVKEAKASGASNILILDNKGKAIDSIPVNDETTRELFLAVPNLQKTNKDITLSYTPLMKTPLPANYTPSYAEDVKTYGTSQVNPLTEFIKGTNEATKGVIDLGGSIVNWVESGGKVAKIPNEPSDIFSSTVTAPIKQTVDASGKTTTTFSIENAKTNLSDVLKSIEENPARQAGRLTPTIEMFLGSAGLGELPSLVKGGSSAVTTLAKGSTTPKVSINPSDNVQIFSRQGYTPKYPSRTLPNDIFASDMAQPSNFISKNVNLGSGAVKTGGGFSDTGINLGRGSGGTPPSSTPSDFIKAVSNLPTRPSKNASLPSYEFKPTDTEGGNVSTSGKQSLVQKTETKPQETVAKTIQKQLDENQKQVSKILQEQKTTTKTTTKADQAMKEYNDVLASRKAKSKQMLEQESQYSFIQVGKIKPLVTHEQKQDLIFEPLQKQVQDIITVPKNDQKQVVEVITIPKQEVTPIFDIPKVQTQIIIPTPKQEVIPVFDIPTEQVTIPKIPVPVQEVIPKIPVPTIIDIPVPTDTTTTGGGGGGGFGKFFPPTGSTGGHDEPRGSKSTLFADYDVSEDPLGLSSLGKVEYNPFGNVETKPQKIAKVSTKTPTSKGNKLPKYKGFKNMKNLFTTKSKKKSK